MLTWSRSTNSSLCWMEDWGITGRLVQKEERSEAIGDQKMSSCRQTSNVPWKSLSVSKWPTGSLVFLSGNISGAVIQQEQPGCIKADGLSGSFFQIHFHDRFYFRHMMGCRCCPRNMLYLGKQARRPSVSNTTRCPDNGHSSYSEIIAG